MCTDGYLYSAHGHTYYLHPVFEFRIRRRRVLWADMYNATHDYVGVWGRDQMPLRLIWGLEAWGKYVSLFEGKPTSPR